MVVETFDALVSERGDTGKIWASLLKDTLKRRRPDFSETYYGFRTFGNLLEEAQTRGLFEFGRDEKSGTYVYRGANAQVELQPAEPPVEAPAAPDVEPVQPEAADELAAETQGEQPTEVPAPAREPRRRGGRGRKGREGQAPVASEDTAMATWPAPTPDLAEAIEPVAAAPLQDERVEAETPVAAEEAPAPAKERRRATRTPRKPAARKGAPAAVEAPEPVTAVMPDEVAQEGSAVAEQAAPPADDSAAAEGEGAKPARKKSSRPAHKAPSRKPATRAPRRPAKAKTPPENG
jgi:hypothetical protein